MEHRGDFRAPHFLPRPVGSLALNGTPDTPKEARRLSLLRTSMRTGSEEVGVTRKLERLEGAAVESRW